MNDLIKLPLFGIFLTLFVWEISLIISKKTKKVYFNPLLISIIIICFFLIIFKIDIADYLVGGSILNFFLAPATVVLALPLFKQLHLLKRNAGAILLSICIGVLTSLVSVTLLCKFFQVDELIFLSLLPKSITTAIGIEVSKQIGGLPGISVVSIVFSGITGAIIAPFVLAMSNVKSKVAQGVAIGTSAHAAGTAKAIELGEIEGAFSGLSIGLAGVITSLLIPLLLGALKWLFIA